MSKDKDYVKSLGDLSPSKQIREATKQAIKNVANSKEQKKNK